MSSSQWRWATAAAIVAAIAWTHGALLSHGLRSDDYFVLRPWTSAEIRSALTGSWDPLGLQDEYHRPLTALYESALYPIFHFNARALHLLSLLELAIVCAGLAWFVARETRSPFAGCLAALVLIVHPATPESTTAWIFNQMSLLADAAAVGALLVWQRVRIEGAARWWSLWLLVAIGFFIKEDGAMLVPALLTWQWWRAVWLRDVPKPSRAVVLSAAALVALLAAIRFSLFPVFAQWPPAFGEMPVWFYPRTLLNGPYRVLFLLPDRSIAGALGNVLVVLACAGALALLVKERLRSHAAALFVGGGILMAWVNLPLFLVSGPTRVHLVTLAAAIVIASAVAMIFNARSSVSARRMLAVGVFAMLVSLSLGSKIRTARHEPCSEETLFTDEFVVEWPTVAPELRAWVKEKRLACAAGNYQQLPADLVVTRVAPIRR